MAGFKFLKEGIETLANKFNPPDTGLAPLPQGNKIHKANTAALEARKKEIEGAIVDNTNDSATPYWLKHLNWTDQTIKKNKDNATPIFTYDPVELKELVTRRTAKDGEELPGKRGGAQGEKQAFDNTGVMHSSREVMNNSEAVPIPQHADTSSQIASYLNEADVEQGFYIMNYDKKYPKPLNETTHYAQGAEREAMETIAKEKDASANMYGRFLIAKDTTSKDSYGLLAQLQTNQKGKMRGAQESVKEYPDRVREMEEVIDDMVLRDDMDGTNYITNDDIGDMYRELEEAKIKMDVAANYQPDPAAMKQAQRNIVRESILQTLSFGHNKFRWPTADTITNTTGLDPNTARQLYNHDIKNLVVELLKDSGVLTKRQAARLSQEAAHIGKWQTQSSIANPWIDEINQSWPMIRKVTQGQHGIKDLLRPENVFLPRRDATVEQVFFELDLTQLRKIGETKGIPFKELVMGTTAAGVLSQSERVDAVDKLNQEIIKLELKADTIPESNPRLLRKMQMNIDKKNQKITDLLFVE